MYYIMYSNFLVIKKLLLEDNCYEKKKKYLKCIQKECIYNNKYNIEITKCDKYLKDYIRCLKYKNSPPSLID